MLLLRLDPPCLFFCLGGDLKLSELACVFCLCLCNISTILTQDIKVPLFKLGGVCGRQQHLQAVAPVLPGKWQAGTGANRGLEAGPVLFPSPGSERL